MGAQETIHKGHVDVEQAPGYLKPITTIEEFTAASSFTLSPDTSMDAIIKEVLADPVILPDKEERDGVLQTYKEKYNNSYLKSDRERELAAAQKKLKKLRKAEEKQAENEDRPRNEKLWNEEYVNKFLTNYVENQERLNSDNAAKSALLKMAVKDLDASTMEKIERNVVNKQREAINLCKMNDALVYLASIKFEYLTRGAIMACTGGAVCRRLNLPLSHGVYYGKSSDPVINKDDGQVGDACNITNFGLCAGTNPPLEKVELEDFVMTDESGRFLAPKNEDSVERGYRCMPEVVSPGWHNTYKKTQIGERDAVSTKSFLVCIHGGLIYPVSSGQHSDFMALQEDDKELKHAFDDMCAELKNMLEEKEKMLSALSLTDSQANRLYEITLEEKDRLKKLESCIDRARRDGYQKNFENIPIERKDTIEYMLKEQAKMRYGESAAVPSLKQDFYSYRRRNGYTQESAYYNDNPGFKPGTDEYTDWRAGRLENKTGKEAREEFEAWDADVKKRGYERLSSFEREEYDKAAQKYGT